MSFIVGMTTAPRPVVTIHESLASLRIDAGYLGPVTVLDDHSKQQSKLDGVNWITNTHTLGPLLNWMALLIRLLKSEAKYLVLLEDDIVWARNAWRTMTDEVEALQFNAFLYSPYSSYTVTKPLALRHGGGEKPTKGLYQMNFHGRAGGSQCYVLNRQAVMMLLSDIQFQARLDDARRQRFDPRRKKENMNCDRDGQITAALMRQHVPVVYRVPSLVNHSLGSGNSSYWQKKEQDTVCFDPEAVPLKSHDVHH